ncbi:MAG: Ldh family oxidoreductase, partial [Sphingomonadales bacterium]
MRFRPPSILNFAEGILRALGTPAENAAEIAESLMRSDMRGYGTHGVGLLPLYAEMVADGAIDPTAEPIIRDTSGNVISVDGRLAYGQLTGAKATDAGVKMAKKDGVAVVAIRDGAHLGRLGEWAERASSDGLVFFAFANTGGGAKNVAPFGGFERKLSTNPIAFGVPTFDAIPFNIIVDFATSQVSGSVIRDHYRVGERLNDAWTTTTSGEPVTDAEDFMAGEGAILPLGGLATGHKGYGLAVIAELMGGFAGGTVVGQADPKWFSNAAIFVLFDPTKLLAIDDIESRIAAFAKHIRDDNVRLPGEGSHNRAIDSEAEGAQIPGHVLVSLCKMAK